MESSLASSEPRPVDVQLYLAGGHQHMVTLGSDDPLLQQLFTALAANTQPAMNHAPILFQLPLKAGRAACSFVSTQLVSIVTEPPILVQLQSPPSPRWATPVLPSPYVQIDHFLTPAEQHQLLVYTEQHESDFAPSQVSPPSPDYRLSRVSHHFQTTPLATIFTSRLQVHLPHILRTFKTHSFRPAHIEIQLTAHNDGDYFKSHTDSDQAENATRELTYVYYFYREPKSFSGGDLRLYDSRIEHGQYVRAESFQTIEPRSNRLVVFFSRCHHEVCRTYCVSREFADSRFTVNGWLHRQAPPRANSIEVPTHISQ